MKNIKLKKRLDSNGIQIKKFSLKYQLEVESSRFNQMPEILLQVHLYRRSKTVYKKRCV